MYLSGLVGRTLRSVPSGVAPWIGLAARSGFVRPVVGGVVLLPLGIAVIRRIERLLLEGLELDPLQVRAGRGQVLETVGRLLVVEVQSYRQLPLRIATSLAGWDARDDVSWPGACDDLLVAGAFATSQEALSFASRLGLQMAALARASGTALTTAGPADGPGEWFVPNDGGVDQFLACPHCLERARIEVARFMRPSLPGESEVLRLVHTPGATTIQSLADMLDVGSERTLKAVLVADSDGAVVFVVVRGDLDVSHEKLGALLGQREFRPATEAEILATGAVPGFASPMGLSVRTSGATDGILVAIDESAYSGHSFVAGANRPDFHFAGVDPRRDMTATVVGDLALAPKGAACARCGARLTMERGSIVARRHRLPSPTYGDETGVEKQAHATAVTIDSLAWLEQIIAACSDDSGIAWPAVIAPADVHLVDLKAVAESRQAAQLMQAGGLRVLYDDRPIAAGAKFTDADLIGCPLRVTVSPRSLQAGGAEVAFRRGRSSEVVPLHSLTEAVQARLLNLMSN